MDLFKMMYIPFIDFVVITSMYTIVGGALVYGYHKIWHKCGKR